jgi:hypothetical protein
MDTNQVGAVLLKLTHGRPISGAAVVDDRFHHRRAVRFQTARLVVWASLG